MGMAYDGEAVVREGRLVLEGLPFEDGRAVRVAVTPRDETEIDSKLPGELSDEEWIVRVRRVARAMGERHPHAPILSDHDVSRASIYEDAGL